MVEVNYYSTIPLIMLTLILIYLKNLIITLYSLLYYVYVKS